MINDPNETGNYILVMKMLYHKERCRYKVYKCSIVQIRKGIIEFINSVLISIIKNYSYLALVSGITCEADYIFVPEDPAKPNWQDNLCKKITQVFYF